MSSNQITILEGADLKTFLDTLAGGTDEIYRVRIWTTPNGTIKVKANESVWTWALGTADD
jgi:hypothetical protein